MSGSPTTREKCGWRWASASTELLASAAFAVSREPSSLRGYYSLGQKCTFGPGIPYRREARFTDEPFVSTLALPPYQVTSAACAIAAPAYGIQRLRPGLVVGIYRRTATAARGSTLASKSK